MARINGSVSQRADSYSFYIEWSESKASDYISTNKTTVTATAYIYCSAHTAWASGLSQTLTIDGTKFTDTKTVNLSSGVTVALVSGSKTITHNADGSKSISISADCDLPDGSGWGPNWGSASGTVALTKIPRSAAIKSFTVTNISGNEGLTKLKFNFTADSTIDYIWYSTNNGSSWSGYNVSDGTSGSVTVPDLSPNTSYKCKLRVRRKDSQLTTDSSVVTKSTYDIARFSDYGNFNLGDSVTVKYINPAGANIQVGIYDINGENAYAEYRTVTGSSYTFNFTDAELDSIYKAMKTANSLSAMLYINTNNNAYRERKDIVITLKGNQKTGHVNENESWKRTKKWINVNGLWKRCVRWVNVNGTWKRCI